MPVPWGRIRSAPAWAWALAALGLLGVVLRVRLTTGDVGLLDADEAVVGLQAVRAAHGDEATYFLGQRYGGTLEALLASIPVRFVGGETAALRVTAGSISVASVVLLFFLARRLFPDRKAAAWLAAGLLFAWPPIYVWFGTRTLGFYASSLALGLATCLLLAILRDDQRYRWYALLGLVTGLAWWQSPYLAYFAVPGVLWLVAHRRWQALVRLPLALPSAVLGALPWLLANVGEGFPSLDAGDYGGYAGTYLGKVWYVLHTGLPVALGLKMPYVSFWAESVAVGRTVYLVLLAGILALTAVGLWRRRLAAFGLVTFPFLYALTPVGSTSAHGRYFLFLSPWLALLLAEVAARSRARLLAVGATVVVTTWLGLSAMGAIGWRNTFRPSTEPVAELLRADGIGHAYADYFLAYKLAFESDGDVVVAPFQSFRDRNELAAVRSAARVAYVFSVGDTAVDRARAGFARLGIDVVERSTPDFLVLVPERAATPEELDPAPLGF